MIEIRRKGIRRLVDATLYSASGLKAAWKNEEAFRQEVILAVIMIPCAFWLAQTTTQTVLLLLTLFIVLIAELLNTAIEVAINRIGDEKHELSKRAKDLGSAAVFVSLMTTAIVWSYVFYERFFG